MCNDNPNFTNQPICSETVSVLQVNVTVPGYFCSSPLPESRVYLRRRCLSSCIISNWYKNDLDIFILVAVYKFKER